MTEISMCDMVVSEKEKDLLGWVLEEVRKLEYGSVHFQVFVQNSQLIRLEIKDPTRSIML